MTEAESKRDLLQKFFFRDNLTGKFDELAKEEVEEEAEGGLELSLGLSLNGRFGIDPKRLKNLPLLRSSSVSDLVFTNGDGDGGGACTTEPSNFSAALERTCSLPPETEEEWRKRKETQSLRRMEAKRKRLEKMRSIKTARDHVVSEAYCEENGRIGEGHVSIGSPGIGSSRISESEPQQIQEGITPSEARSPARVHSLPPKPNEQGQTLSIGATRTASNSPAVNTDNRAKEMMKNMMVDMPCVSTRGIGPNGKRVEGFLYRYRKGEEVRIVCVCHGSFLSPAEFVKHAGGGDVLQPLKHIVVNPSPLL